MKFTFEFREQSIYFLGFTLLFQLNSLSDLIYHVISISSHNDAFIYFKVIEFFVFLSVEILILTFLCLKKIFFIQTQNYLDYNQPKTNPDWVYLLIFIIIYLFKSSKKLSFIIPIYPYSIILLLQKLYQWSIWV